jgi:hypothetical protein
MSKDAFLASGGAASSSLSLAFSLSTSRDRLATDTSMPLNSAHRSKGGVAETAIAAQLPHRKTRFRLLEKTDRWFFIDLRFFMSVIL